MNARDLLVLWLAGVGVESDVLDQEPLKTLMDEGEGLGAWDELCMLAINRRKPEIYNGTPQLPRQRLQLEFMQLVERHGKEKKQANRQYFGEDIDRHTPATDILRMLKASGFEVVREEDYTQKCPEKFYVLWERTHGLLAFFDTYTYDSVAGMNSGEVHFNLECPQDVRLGGGSYTYHPYGDYVVYAAHFPLEGWFSAFQEISQKKGRFLSPWKHNTRPFLTHSRERSDTEGMVFEKTYGPDGYFDRIIKARIQTLPTEMRKACLL
jgi:hypothetical protein